MKTITSTPQGVPHRRFNPLDNYFFCKVMGEKGDEKQLLGFLNAVLGRTGPQRIASVEILENKTFSPETAGRKGSVFDVRAVLGGGTRVNIEVQLRNKKNMDRRSLFYWSREYVENLDAGQDYRNLSDVIAINIVNFKFLPAGGFHTRFHLREYTDRDIVLTEALEIHYIDMVKWRRLKGKDILNDPLHRWLAWFNESSPAELIDEVKKMDEAILTADERMAFVTGDRELIHAYYNRVMWECDIASDKNYAREQGMAEGKARGMAQGLVEGKAEGKAESKTEIARNLKKMGLSPAQIAEGTGLSPEDVERL